jgi:uncharacterized membrane protein
MADLIAIGYDDTTTAVQAIEEVERLEADLVIQADAVAAIIRSEEGKFRTVTNAQGVPGPGARQAQARHVCAFHGRGEDDAGQGRRRALEVR